MGSIPSVTFGNIRLADDMISQNKGVNIGATKTAIRVFGGTHNGFAPDVETGVYQNRYPGFLMKNRKELMQDGIARFIHGLDPSRIIHMGNRRDGGTNNIDPFAKIIVRLHQGLIGI